MTTSRSKLQKIAGERNWLKGYVVRDISLITARELKLSHDTYHRLRKINRELRLLRDSIDTDWGVQRARLLEKKANHST